MSGVLMRWWALALYQNNMVIMFLQFGGGGGGGGESQVPPPLYETLCMYICTNIQTYIYCLIDLLYSKENKWLTKTGSKHLVEE